MNEIYLKDLPTHIKEALASDTNLWREAQRIQWILDRNNGDTYAGYIYESAAVLAIEIHDLKMENQSLRRSLYQERQHENL